MYTVSCKGSLSIKQGPIRSVNYSIIKTLLWLRGNFGKRNLSVNILKFPSRVAPLKRNGVNTRPANSGTASEDLLRGASQSSDGLSPCLLAVRDSPRSLSVRSVLVRTPAQRYQNPILIPTAARRQPSSVVDNVKHGDLVRSPPACGCGGCLENPSPQSLEERPVVEAICTSPREGYIVV